MELFLVQRLPGVELRPRDQTGSKERSGEAVQEAQVVQGVAREEEEGCEGRSIRFRHRHTRKYSSKLEKCLQNTVLQHRTPTTIYIPGTYCSKKDKQVNVDSG